MFRALWGFHHQVKMWYTVKLPKLRPDEGWDYPLTVEAMRDARIEEMEV